MQNENSFLYSFFTSPSHSKEEKDIKFKNELEKLVEIQENYEKCKIVISMLCSIPPGIYQPQSDMVEIFTALIGILHFDISQLILQKLPKLLYNCQLKGKKLSQLLDKVLLAFTEIIDQDRKYLVPIIGALSQFTLTTRHQRIVLTTAMEACDIVDETDLPTILQTMLSMTNSSNGKECMLKLRSVACSISKDTLAMMLEVTGNAFCLSEVALRMFLRSMKSHNDTIYVFDVLMLLVLIHRKLNAKMALQCFQGILKDERLQLETLEKCCNLLNHKQYANLSNAYILLLSKIPQAYVASNGEKHYLLLWTCQICKILLCDLPTLRRSVVVLLLHMCTFDHSQINDCYVEFGIQAKIYAGQTLAKIAVDKPTILHPYASLLFDHITSVFTVMKHNEGVLHCLAFVLAVLAKSDNAFQSLYMILIQKQLYAAAGKGVRTTMLARRQFLNDEEEAAQIFCVFASCHLILNQNCSGQDQDRLLGWVSRILPMASAQVRMAIYQCYRHTILLGNLLHDSKWNHSMVLKVLTKYCGYISLEEASINVDLKILVKQNLDMHTMNHQSSQDLFFIAIDEVEESWKCLQCTKINNLQVRLIVPSIDALPDHCQEKISEHNWQLSLHTAWSLTIAIKLTSTSCTSPVPLDTLENLKEESIKLLLEYYTQCTNIIQKLRSSIRDTAIQATLKVHLDTICKCNFTSFRRIHVTRLLGFLIKCNTMQGPHNHMLCTFQFILQCNKLYVEPFLFSGVLESYQQSFVPHAAGARELFSQHTLFLTWLVQICDKLSSGGAHFMYCIGVLASVVDELCVLPRAAATSSWIALASGIKGYTFSCIEDALELIFHWLRFMWSESDHVGTGSMLLHMISKLTFGTGKQYEASQLCIQNLSKIYAVHDNKLSENTALRRLAYNPCFGHVSSNRVHWSESRNSPESLKAIEVSISLACTMLEKDDGLRFLRGIVLYMRDFYGPNDPVRVVNKEHVELKMLNASTWFTFFEAIMHQLLAQLRSARCKPGKDGPYAKLIAILKTVQLLVQTLYGTLFKSTKVTLTFSKLGKMMKSCTKSLRIQLKHDLCRAIAWRINFRSTALHDGDNSGDLQYLSNLFSVAWALLQDLSSIARTMQKKFASTAKGTSHKAGVPYIKHKKQKLQSDATTIKQSSLLSDICFNIDEIEEFLLQQRSIHHLRFKEQTDRIDHPRFKNPEFAPNTYVYPTSVAGNSEEWMQNCLKDDDLDDFSGEDSVESLCDSNDNTEDLQFEATFQTLNESKTSTLFTDENTIEDFTTLVVNYKKP